MDNSEESSQSRTGAVAGSASIQKLLTVEELRQLKVWADEPGALGRVEIATRVFEDQAAEHERRMGVWYV